jgi:putative oxidoreductase
VTQHTTTASRTATSRGANIALWVLQGLTAAFFASAAAAKLAGTAQMVQLFDDIGVGQWFRYAVAILEIAGAIGLLIPRLTGLAALGLVGLMLGAVATHLFIVGGNPASALVGLVLVAVIAWFRRDRTAALLGR